MRVVFQALLASVVLFHGFCFAFTSLTAAADVAGADPKAVDADFGYQGEYVGELPGKDGGKEKYGVQVIALGGGKFQAVGYHGGLPGEGWNGEPKINATGELKDGAVTLKGDEGSGVVKDGKLLVQDGNGNTIGTFSKIERKSPTLGMAPPSGAVVLFDGKNADAFEKGRVTEDGLLMQGVTSKQKFGSHTIHIEFRLPYQPNARGQGRGNSGLYLQGRYEVQMLDSFGLNGEDNECGGVYKIAKPKVNMCLPPLSWQTYDIEFTAGKFDDSGKCVEDPKMTVRHNGVVIHQHLKLPGNSVTTAAPNKAGAAPGPVYLQDHGNPVRYRNIWVVEKK